MSKAEGRVPIEISSSPEPEFFDNHKRTRTKASSAVIELIDSDDDLDALPARVLPSAVAGPSSRPLPPRQLQPRAGGSNSIENIPRSHRKVKATASRNTPLFLPSDEENNPPLDPVPRTPPVEQPQPFHIDVDMDDVYPLDPPPQTPKQEVEPEIDHQSTAIARILEIVPDIESDWLLALVSKHMLEHADQVVGTVVEHILHALFEDPKYPKVDRLAKGKRKQTEEQQPGSPAKKPKIDYRDTNRRFPRTAHYGELALEHLQTSFPFIPKTYLRTCLSSNNGLYAPTHLYLHEQEKQQQQRRDAHEKVNLPYNRRVTPFRPKGKGAASVTDDDFEAERKWLMDELSGGGGGGGSGGGGGAPNAKGEDANDMDDGECEDGIECGCCFSTFRFDKIVQCPEMHLFCSSCMTSYASTLLGTHDPNIKCMDQSGCSALIPASELQRFLPPKLMELWERVKQRKEVEAAGLEGLEECPFCEWGCVIENPDEKLLRCGNTDGCGAVSCRSCKKLDHLPKSCKEVEEDKHLDGRHAVEEAMTKALMRNCPKCSKPFVKDSGCNKMSCPNCSTLSCYVCRQIITGYEHFNQAQAGHPGSSKDAGKCLLWDAVEQRHADEVKAAAERALEEYKRDNPDVDEQDIKVDLPVAPPPAANNPHAYPYINHAQQLVRNAQAALDRATADHARLRAAEEAHRARMLEHEADIRLLQETSGRMPHMAEAYRVRAHELAVAVADDQTRWYQMRVETQNAQMRIEQARGQIAVYQGQQVRHVPQPGYDVFVRNQALPVRLPPLVPPRAAAPRRVRAPRKRGRGRV